MKEEIKGFKRITDTTEGVIPKKKPKIYLAHNHKWWNTKREARVIKILESRGYEVVNPFDSEEDYIEKYGTYDKHYSEEYANEITEKDWNLIINCDELFAWYPLKDTVIGTPQEVCWAKQLGMKVTALTLSGRPHPFLWSKRVNIYKYYISYQDFKKDKPFFVRE